MLRRPSLKRKLSRTDAQNEQPILMHSYWKHSERISTNSSPQGPLKLQSAKDQKTIKKPVIGDEA
eukprot:6340064-Amphidinium_carterae.2